MRFQIGLLLFPSLTQLDIQLGIEYDPQPPFDAGAPERADPSLVAAVRDAAAARQGERESAVRWAAARLGND